MRYRIMQVHTPTGHRADWGTEDDRTVAERVAMSLSDPPQHLMGLIEPVAEEESVWLRWAGRAA